MSHENVVSDEDFKRIVALALNLTAVVIKECARRGGVAADGRQHDPQELSEMADELDAVVAMAREDHCDVKELKRRYHGVQYKLLDLRDRMEGSK